MASKAVEYALTFLLGISLLTGLTVTTTDIVDNRDEQITEDQLEHVGIEISTVISQHHKAYQKHQQEEYVIGEEATTVQYNSSTVVDEPRVINGKRYTVQVDNSTSELVLTAQQSDVQTRVPLADDVQIRDGSGGIGGRLVVRYDSDSDKFELDTDEEAN